jgi:predicted aconitase with swiveling domain
MRKTMICLNRREKVIRLACILAANGTISIYEAISEILAALYSADSYKLQEEDKLEYAIAAFAMTGVDILNLQ